MDLSDLSDLSDRLRCDHTGLGPDVLGRAAALRGAVCGARTLPREPQPSILHTQIALISIDFSLKNGGFLMKRGLSRRLWSTPLVYSLGRGG